MLENFIKEARELNTYELEHIEGYKLYYSRIKNILSLLTYLALIGFGLFLIISDTRNEGKLLGLFSFVFFLYMLIKTIGNLMLRNPVIILTRDKIYHLKTNQWYSLYDYELSDSSNRTLAFRRKNANGYNEFAESRWELSSDDEFMSLLKVYTHSLKRKE
jgi:hypothetical protein